MVSLLTASIGMGLAVSLLFTELFGLAAGGMVVPGYIALYLHKPLSIAVTLGTGAVTFGVVHMMKSVILLYGRRMTVAMILVGYALGAGVREVTGGVFAAAGVEFEVIGFIIPGLVAIWMNRQGVVETVTAILTVSALVRLALMILFGEDLLV